MANATKRDEVREGWDKGRVGERGSVGRERVGESEDG